MNTDVRLLNSMMYNLRARLASAAKDCRSSSIARILHTQDVLLRHHLPPALYSSMEVPARHAGINSIKVPAQKGVEKPPLVLLHGFGSGLGFFFATLPYLAQSGRAIYLVDWLGCGGSDRPKVSPYQVTANFFTSSMDRWMDSEDIREATIVGHSLGGLLAREYSERHPERIHSLVLASPAGFGAASGRGVPDTFGRQLLDVLWVNAVTPQTIVRLAGKTKGLSMVRKAVANRFSRHTEFNKNLLADYLYEITVAPACGEYALNSLVNPPFKTGAIVARRPITELPGKGQFPVHVIFGDYDWLGTPSAVENARRAGARVSIMRNSGHHLYMDNPAEFAQLCLST